MTMHPITLYNPPPVACRPYDPLAPNVARLVTELILSVLPDVEVEHLGSTSVPGCAGKGYIDLMVLYPDGALEITKSWLATLGFQRQTSRDPFPEERPMRVGSFKYRGRDYPIHAHVVVRGSPEVKLSILFRDRLKDDVKLRAEYVTEKHRIMAAGVTDPIDYSNMKGAFVQRVLAAIAERDRT